MKAVKSKVLGRGAAIAAILAALGLMVAGDLKKHTRFHRYSANSSVALEYFDSEVPQQVSLSPDGRFVLSKIRSAAAFTICVADCKTRRTLRKLTSTQSQLSLTWRPDCSGIVFLADSGGNREYRLFEWRLSTGNVRSYHTPPIHSAAPPIRWACDGSFLVLAQEATKEGQRLIKVETQEGNFNAWHPLFETWPDSDFQVSPDSRFLAFVAKTDPSAVSIASLIVPATKVGSMPVGVNGEVRDLAWAPDSRSILFTRRGLGDEYFYLGELDVISRKATDLYRKECDIQHPHFLPGKRGLVFEANFAGENQIELGSEWRQPLSALTLPGSDNRIASVSADGEYVEGLSTTPELASTVVRWKTHQHLDGKPPQEADSEDSGLFSQRTIRRSVAGSLPISIWKPKEKQVSHPIAAVIFVHGGPHLQQRPDWDFRLQFLLDHDIEYAVVNYQGSSGYGQKFEASDSLGSQADDVREAVNYIEQTSGLPQDRVVLMGESYGSEVVGSAISEMKGSIGGVVFVSPVGFGSMSKDRSLSARFVQVYKGKNDRIGQVADLERDLADDFRATSLDRAESTFDLVPNEGHQFRRNQTWAQIYANLVSALTAK